MSDHELRPEHRSLRELLRGADPAAAAERLPPEAVAAMRRRTLEEAEAHAEATGISGIPWSRVAAGAATLVVVLGLALAVDRDRWLPSPSDPTPTTADRPAEDPGAAATDGDGRTPDPSPGTEQPVADTPPKTGTPDTRPGASGAVAGAVPPPPPPSREDAGTAPADRRRKPRDLRFTTPGGTEIIWTLDPDFELPGPPRNPGRGDTR